MEPCKDHPFDSTVFIPSFLKTFDRIAGKANFHGLKPLPRMEIVGQLCDELLELFFPGRCGREQARMDLEEYLAYQMDVVTSHLKGQLYLAFRYDDETLGSEAAEERSDRAVRSVASRFPSIRLSLKADAQAAYEGDPAARNIREVILSYPCIKSLTIHRVAHELYRLDVPIIPRMMSEYAHAQTGIDIHPGAQIGSSFFIDHGTGTVIGETTVIGSNVKIYQGVTLGALSFPRDACGALIKGAKRHPTIEDDVTIYANATVLGDITIGRGTTIGSNVWIKESVAPNTLVTIGEPEIRKREIRKSQ